MALKLFRLGFKDYLALGISLMLAFAVWLVHNLSLEYSALVQRGVVAVCEIDGHSNMSDGVAEVAASCQLQGKDLLGIRLMGRHHPVTLNVTRDDMRHFQGDVFYMTSNDLTKYFHTIFSDKSRLEYFVTDTVFFTFNSVRYKKVPVKMSANITYKPQYMPLGGLRVMPDSVLIYGNKEILDGVNAVTTELVYVNNLSSKIFGKARLKPIKGVRMSTRDVDYSMDVVRYVQKEAVLPVRMVKTPRGVTVKVFPFNATVRYRMRFPADTNMDGAYVAVQYSDFVNSISGKCVGEVVGVTEDVISYELEPQVFDCLLEQEVL